MEFNLKNHDFKPEFITFNSLTLFSGVGGREKEKCACEIKYTRKCTEAWVTWLTFINLYSV